MGSEAPSERSGEGGPFSRKLAQFVPLTPAEIAVLNELQSTSRALGRGTEIISEGRSYRTLFIIAEGAAIRYRILGDGRRHVLGILLPGDVAGVVGCFFERALYSVRTITDSVICPVPLSRLSHLFGTYPQLAAKIFWIFSCETAIYAERLITISRMSALERISHFLLELLVRLQGLELADERSFRLPLTQELIADALGLSIPYVNRVLRQLREDNLVCIKDQLILIKDVAALAALVDFERSYLKPRPIAELMTESS
jgi:CRP-like cAMP-binding protein